MTSSTASKSPLSATSLSSYIAASLPTDASPQLKSPTDAIAIACHAGMLAVGFRLIGLGEDHQIDAHSEQKDTQPLPSEWNASSAHAFRYKHSQSSMEYLLKVSRLGNKTVIYGIGMGDDKTTSFDLTTKDFISDSSLPATPSSSSAAPEDVTHNIQTIFISPTRLTDLGSLLRLNIIQKLLPSLQKEGYEESPSQTSTPATRQQQPQQRQQPAGTLPRAPAYDPLHADPLLPAPARPNPITDPTLPRPLPGGDFAPPGFEDEYDLNRPLGRGGHYNPYAPGGGAYPNLGERDLYPQGLGPNDPLRIGGGGGPGFRGGGGGGMHPTFDDPLFGGRGRDEGFGGFGGAQAPPGARYDPLGPGDGPRRGAGGGGRFGGGGGFGGMGGAPPNPFSGFGSGDFI